MRRFPLVVLLAACSSDPTPSMMDASVKDAEVITGNPRQLWIAPSNDPGSLSLAEIEPSPF